MQTAILSVLIACGLFYTAVLFGEAMDSNIDNHNVMLCEASLRSGNVEYQTKCLPYFATGEIEYLR
jgi:hypothetical protein